MDLGVILFYQPIFNLLVVFYRLFGGNLGWAIIAIALLFRFIMFPITIRQSRMMKDSQELNKKMDEIKKQYKNNKEKQNEEMMKIQSEYLPGQLSGCVSMILQLILLINVFNVVRNLLIDGGASFDKVAYSFIPTFGAEAVNTSFFGVHLTQSASAIGYSDILAVLPYVLLAIAVGVVQFLSTKMLMPKTQKAEESEKQDKTEIAEPNFSEVLKQSSRQTAYIMPVFITFMSLGFPAGLSIYWTAQSTFVIIQQFILGKVESNGKD